MRGFVPGKLAVSLIGTVLVLSGCSGSPAADDPSSGQGDEWAIPIHPDPGARQAINDLYNGEANLAAAGEESIRRCMARSGFRYIKLPTGNQDVNPGLNGDGFSLSVEVARKRGYGIKERVEQVDKETRENAKYNSTNGLSPEQVKGFDVAFFGSSDSQVSVLLPDGSTVSFGDKGCLAESRKKIFGSIEKFGERTAMAGMITQNSQQRALADPGIRILNQAWSKCMQDSGYSGLKDPYDAQGRASDAHDGKTSDIVVMAKEIPMAVADAECQAKTGYTMKMHDIQDRYFTAALNVYKSQVAEIEEITRDSLKRARPLL
ncbi:hypothetical protein GCM10023194_60520 [Planotetraspora phitsanulokensis]|uniref:Secreted protein n=1 Tax=Planotetraspora phitsanulokensis TaxID=575192 RepID=A0A8J3U4C6_9ACTN|nr:hypothetical protein [Planotetraspora phitsanulokensis]GII37727.1 hypothetical protein Pph01_27300 [Planotetraspora phitsanulokensis]